MYKDQEHFTLIYCSRILSPNTFWKIISELSAQLDFRHLMMDASDYTSQRWHSGLCAQVMTNYSSPQCVAGRQKLYSHQKIQNTRENESLKTLQVLWIAEFGGPA